mmetsp:Transcript_38462/g.115338  ORF Transcript_38462/g.115338 Transcript_38462/m.115338 type:complete len:97 (-) Transcript_38462:2456-2746(-)
MCLPTCASTALRGSSNRYRSASLYTTRAMATRAFCPPLSVIPFSPISVISPSGNSRRSCSNAHVRIALRYLLSSNGSLVRPKTTLDLRVSFMTKGD